MDRDESVGGVWLRTSPVFEGCREERIRWPPLSRVG